MKNKDREKMKLGLKILAVIIALSMILGLVIGTFDLF